MFGYININREELSDENKKAYQAYYCGLCRKLKENCGTKGQMLLNYDMTFLVVLLTGLYELANEEISFTCGLHPTRKQMAYLNEATDYAADMNVILSYQNFEDDWKDDRSYAKRTFMKMFEKDYERIRGVYPRQVQAVEEYMKKLAVAEKAKESNIDIVAGYTGEMLGQIFQWKQDEWSRDLESMGFYMGKFIYLLDAYEDLKQDQKKGNYNPLAYVQMESKEEYETFCRSTLTCLMAECAKSFERMPILQHAEILRNILYSGVWTKYEYLKLKEKKTKP